jgi:WD40 repeat protein
MRQCRPTIIQCTRTGVCASVVSLFLAISAAALAEPKTDHYGDALPDGAIARLGTLRLHHPLMISSVRYSRDGQFIISCAVDGTARVWDAQTGAEVDRMFVPRGPIGIDVTPKGLIAIGDQFGHLSFYRLEERKVAPEIRGFNAASAPEGRYVGFRLNRIADRIVWIQYRNAVVIDLEGNILRKLPEFRAYSPANDLAVLGDEKSHVYRFVNAMNGQELTPRNGRIRMPSSHFFYDCLSDDGRRFAVFSERSKRAAVGAGYAERFDFDLEIFDIASGDRLISAAIKLTPGGSLSITGNSRFLLATDFHGTQVFDISKAPHLTEVGRLPYPTVGYSASPDGKTLACSSSTKICLVDTATWTDKSPGPIMSPSDLAFSPDSHQLATVSTMDGVGVWDVVKSHEIVQFPDPRAYNLEVVFCCGGRVVGVGRMPPGLPAELTFYDATTGRRLRRVPIQLTKGEVLIRMASINLHATLDGGVVAVATESGVLLVNAATGAVLTELPPPADVPGPERRPLASAAISSDGALVAMVEKDSDGPASAATLLIYSGRTFKQLMKFRLANPGSVTISPNGQFVVVADGNNLRTIELASAQEASEWSVDRSGFEGPLFLQRGLVLVTVENFRQRSPGRAVFWDAVSGKKRAEQTLVPWSEKGVAVSNDGRLLATSGPGGTALLWGVDSLGLSKPPPQGLNVNYTIAEDWAQLVASARTAYGAMARLVCRGDEAATFIAQSIQLPPPCDAKDVRRLVSNLAAISAEERENAHKSLVALGADAEQLLEQESRNSSEKNIQAALQSLIAAGQSPRANSLNELRLLRSVQVLEWIGTPTAMACLRTIAAGPRSARFTRQAQAAIERTTAVSH